MRLEEAQSVFTRNVPDPRGLAVSPGGAYGSYMYVLSGQHEVYRAAPDGTAEHFSSIRPNFVRAHPAALVFDTTPSQRFGGYLYAVIDNGGEPGPESGGLDRILPDGSVQVCALHSGFPNLFGAWDAIIDDQGQFGFDMFVSDFETDEGGSPSTLVRIRPDCSRSAFFSVRPRGAMGIDLDRFGGFGGNIIVTNPRIPSTAPWWNGADNGVYRAEPSGNWSRLIPDHGLGYPIDVLVDAVGTFNGNLLVFYPQQGLLVQYDPSGLEVSRTSLTGASDLGLAQDRWGAFGFGLYYTVPGSNEIRRIHYLGAQASSARVTRASTAKTPLEYALRSYPNPFNPTTTVEFDLPEPAVVSLRIYDVAGRLVAELASERTYEPGRHRLVFDGTHASSGIYFYRLETGRFNQTRKVLLFK